MADDVRSHQRGGALQRSGRWDWHGRLHSAFGRRAISTAVFVVLARLLVPEDFGLVALAAVFVALLGLVRDQGLVQAVVQRRSLEPLHLDTAFVIAPRRRRTDAPQRSSGSRR
ncbi:MAG: oligosaccharide flippase family protein [Acidimicrobiales bacterium]|nr:oligosaccharide flippase family protein [Acidimicrobiales bacterium]